MINDRNLPVLYMPVVTVLKKRSETQSKQLKLRTVWSRVLTVDYYRGAISSFMPVIDLIDLRDSGGLLRMESNMIGTYQVRLSLVDPWSGEGSWPDIDEIRQKLFQSKVEPAGIQELALFAEILKNEGATSALGLSELIAIAPRESLNPNDISCSFPSLGYDQEHAMALSLTYNLVLHKRHVHVLVVG